jgi:hypothetical protein
LPGDAGGRELVGRRSSMTKHAGKRRLLVILTIASILVGLNFAGPGVLFLVASALAILGRDVLSIGAHANEILTTSAMLTVVGAVPVASGVYALVGTGGFRRWGNEVPVLVRIAAVVAWVGLAVDGALFLTPFALKIPGFE